jgi:hypothetical protein
LILSGTNERTFEETQQEKTVALGRRTKENGRKAEFDRLCKLEKRGDEIKKIFFSETTEPISTKLC